MLQIPLAAIPNQRLNVVLDGQNCTIKLRQMGKYLYFTLYLEQTAIAKNLIAMPGTQILQGLHTGFSGNFMMIDTTAPDAYSHGVPEYTGLENRFMLLYLTDADIEELAEILNGNQ